MQTISQYTMDVTTLIWFMMQFLAHAVSTHILHTTEQICCSRGNIFRKSKTTYF